MEMRMRYVDDDRDNDRNDDPADEDVVRDGEGMRVPLFLADAAQQGVTDASARILDFRGMAAGRAPGYCFLDASQSDSPRIADAQVDREAALAERDKYLADAWKNPGTKKDDPRIALTSVLNRRTGSLSLLGAEIARESAMADRDKRLANAWKNPGAAANEVEAQRKGWVNE
jgi:hypothetical protein